MYEVYREPDGKFCLYSTDLHAFVMRGVTSDIIVEYITVMYGNKKGSPVTLQEELTIEKMWIAACTLAKPRPSIEVYREVYRHD